MARLDSSWLDQTSKIPFESHVRKHIHQGISRIRISLPGRQGMTVRIDAIVVLAQPVVVKMRDVAVGIDFLHGPAGFIEDELRGVAVGIGDLRDGLVSL